VAYNPNPRLVDAIQRLGGSYAPILLATALVESGGRLDAVGDGGMSIGPYQMHSRGRGYGVPPAKRMDPVFSTTSALAEFKRFAAKGLSGPELAYAAQRPADRSGYIRKIASVLPEAQRILGSGGGGGAAPAPAGGGGRRGAARGGGALDQMQGAAGIGGGLTAESLDLINQYARQSQLEVMAGLEPSDVMPVVTQLQYNPAPMDDPQGVGIVLDRAGQGRGHPANPARQAASVATGGPTSFGGGGILKGAIPGSPVPGQQPRAASHPTSGLAGYPAFDYMARAGTPTVAPVSGKVVRLSGRDPSAGGAPGGPLGYSIYLQGTNGKRYFLTHLDNVSVKVGDNVRQGQQIAVVANGPPSWSSPHVHMGVWG